MLAFKGTIRPNSKEFIEEHAMAKQLIWALTQRNLLRCILKYQNRLKTILIL
jgi:hypothetical protein